MTKYINQYGYCIIPKNKLFFRGSLNTTPNNFMFFTTQHWVAAAFNQNIQVWKTNQSIRILFLMEDLNESCWVTSALPQLYYTIFPEETDKNLNDLDIKNLPITKREKLVKHLVEHEISGWLTSLENRVELEICLFNQQKKKQLQLIDTIDISSTKYFKNSLENIKIYPSDTFYEKTKHQLNSQTNFAAYHKKVKAWINDEIHNGMDKNEAAHYYMNLRTKLKI